MVLLFLSNWFLWPPSPAVVLVSALGSLVLLVALAVYRHKHPLNLYLLLAFVSAPLGVPPCPSTPLFKRALGGLI